jgi:hypothetical protein
MPRVSSVLKSEYKELIDRLLNEYDKVSEVHRILKDKGVPISRSALYRYRNSHFLPRRQPLNQLFEVLYITGNSNLVRSLEKTLKVYRTHKKCLCDNLLPQDLRRSGRIFLHKLCNGWVCYNIAVHIKSQYRKNKPKQGYSKLVATARTY